MPKIKHQDAQLVIRIPSELIQRVDDFAARVEHATGVKVTRANACRALIQKGLEAQQEEAENHASSS